MNDAGQASHGRDRHLSGTKGTRMQIDAAEFAQDPRGARARQTDHAAAMRLVNHGRRVAARLLCGASQLAFGATRGDQQPGIGLDPECREHWRATLASRPWQGHAETRLHRCHNVARAPGARKDLDQVVGTFGDPDSVFTGGAEPAGDKHASERRKGFNHGHGGSPDRRNEG